MKWSKHFCYFLFSNYLCSIYNSAKLRPITSDNIQKTILCGSIYLGYDYYEYPSSGQEVVIPHSCHSRFCTKCGNNVQLMFLLSH